MQRAIRVRDPRHLPGPRAHVGGGHVHGWSQIALARKLLREAARHDFELVFLVVARFDLETALCTAERHIDDGALVRHQRRECLHLVLVDRRSKPDPALHRKPMLAVNGTPAGEDSILTAQLSRDLHLDHGVAGANLLREPPWKVQGCRGPVEHVVDAAKEL